MTFGGFAFTLLLAMAFAFNLYLGDVIIRIRQDIQYIRKRLARGGGGVETSSKTEFSSEPDPPPPPPPHSPATVNDDDDAAR